MISYYGHEELKMDKADWVDDIVVCSVNRDS